MFKPIRSMKDIINRRTVKRAVNVYLTVLLCIGVASLLTGCAVVIGSEAVEVSVSHSGALVGM